VGAYAPPHLLRAPSSTRAQRGMVIVLLLSSPMENVSESVSLASSFITSPFAVRVGPLSRAGRPQPALRSSAVLGEERRGLRRDAVIVSTRHWRVLPGGGSMPSLSLRGFLVLARGVSSPPRLNPRRVLRVRLAPKPSLAIAALADERSRCRCASLATPGTHILSIGMVGGGSSGIIRSVVSYYSTASIVDPQPLVALYVVLICFTSSIYSPAKTRSGPWIAYYIYGFIRQFSLSSLVLSDNFPTSCQPQRTELPVDIRAVPDRSS